MLDERTLLEILKCLRSLRVVVDKNFSISVISVNSFLLEWIDKYDTRIVNLIWGIRDVQCFECIRQDYLDIKNIMGESNSLINKMKIPNGNGDVFTVDYDDKLNKERRSLIPELDSLFFSMMSDIERYIKS